MGWMVKGLSVPSDFSFEALLTDPSSARINNVMFYLLWTCAPILISIISFFTFVMQGNQLTISVAFTV